MEDAIDCDTPGVDVSNNVASSVLRTDVTICEDELSEQAKEQFDYHSEILRAFQLLARNILANDRLSPVGRHLFCMTLEKDYANCKSVLNYAAAHSELKVTAQPMPPPLVVCGLSRTGSTLLYSLLACDPACRAPLLTDIMQPVPPLTRLDSAEQTQCNVVERTQNETFNNLGLAMNETYHALGLTDCVQELLASHPRYAHEEDQLILSQAGVAFHYLWLAPRDNTEFVNWFLDATNKDFAYEYHKTFIQMLNSVDAPRSHWLLKAPMHTLFIDTLLRHYPSASIIMTHRRLEDTLASCARYATGVANMYYDCNKTDVAIDRRTVVEHRLRAMDLIIHRLVEFRRAHPEKPVCDVFYDDLVAQPIDTVRRIYKHFGLAWSDEFELAMLTWLRDNPQGKQGRNVYTIEDFGLTRNVIEQRYKEYNHMFFHSRESSKTQNGTTTTVSTALGNIEVAAKLT